MLYKSIKKISSSKQSRLKIQNTERRKIKFLKGKVENIDLYESVLNKIITPHK